MMILKEQDDFARNRIRLYCEAHRDLEHDPNTAICTLDFTGFDAIHQTLTSSSCPDFYGR